MAPNVGYPVDFHQQAINNAVFQRLGTAPATPIAGQYYVNTTDGLLYKRNEANTAWEAIGSSQVNHYNVTCGAGANNLSVDNKSGIVSIKTIINSNTGTLDITTSINKATTFIIKDDDSSIDGFNLNAININGVGIYNNYSGNVLVMFGGTSLVFSWFPDYAPSIGIVQSAPYLPQDFLNKVNSQIPGKTTLANADEISIWDSAVSYIAKKITYTNLKAAILTIPLLGWVVGSNTAISASDTITGAFGKLQGQINALLTVTEIEIDFGTTPVRAKRFTITDALVTGSTKKILVNPSGNVATGRGSDDWEWDSIQFAAKANTGNFTLYANASGKILGKRKIFYTIN
jgi:hypothetical protein